MHVQWPAVLFLILGDRHLRLDELDFDAIALPDALAQGQRFRKLITGFEVENPNARLDVGQHVNQAAALGPEGGGHGQAGMKRRHRPAQNLLGRLAFQPGAGGGDLLFAKILQRHASSCRLGFQPDRTD